MKLHFYFLAICLIIGSLLLPARTQAATTGTKIKIEDPVLEKAIREELKLSDDQTLDYEALQKLNSLYPKGSEKVKSLKGLEMAYNLTELFLPQQEITDIGPLRNLYQLKFLALDHNQIKNVCTISSLTKLQKLLISNNEIEDISCLSRLTSLTDLLASSNKIQDITPLNKLRIKWLDVVNNPVSDVSSITAMNELRTLFIDEEKLNEKSKELLQHLSQSGITLNHAPNRSDLTSGMAVMVNNERVLFEHSPIAEAGTTLVQFRPLFEKLGFTIQWNNDTSTIQADKEGVHFSLQVDNVNASLNGSSHELPVAPKNVDGNIFVPIRFVGEASKYDVTWVGSTKTIYLMPIHNVVSPDGMSQITVSGKWLNRIPTTENMFQMYMVNGSNVLFSTTESKAGLPQIKTLADYENAVKKSLEPQKIKDFSEDMKMKINGMGASQFTYSVNAENGSNYTIVQTLINGKYGYFRIVLITRDAVSSEINQDYQNIVQTFQELKTIYQLNQEKFSTLSPKERVLDAAHYYRKLGFFEKDKSLTAQQFDDKFIEFYKGFVDEDWDPFNSKEGFDAFADLYVLQQDTDRVWMEDTEADVGQGNDSYVQALKNWSAISRGTFKPTDIVEKWESEEGPITVTFTLNGQKKSVHPLYMNDFLDTEILKEINILIRDSGYQFAEVVIDQEVFVTVLTAEEKQNIQKDRFMDFVSFE
ncbi:stalk domain-containing protein [Paenibacillus sp. SI8]|uniref:stalk domain-containing protein n=1 Tax=unclassified Paenibacillus TaxID=185978 RepID=UPI00346723FC